MSLLEKILLPGGMSARRCLFPIDDTDRKKLHIELDVQDTKLTNAERGRFINRWGFDPIKGEPVQQDKKWEYEAVDAKNVPAFYTAGFRQRPTRPARSPCQLRNSPVGGLPSRPAKRRLRFDDQTGINDENREIVLPMPVPEKQAKTSSVDLVDSMIIQQENSPASCTLTSSPISPSVHPATYSPMSPSVLSSSCPPALDTSVVPVARLSPVLEKETTELPKFSRSMSESSSFPIQFSPSIQTKEFVTPSSRSSCTLVQKVMTDYASVKKKRSSKPSPRS